MPRATKLHFGSFELSMVIGGFFSLIPLFDYLINGEIHPNSWAGLLGLIPFTVEFGYRLDMFSNKRKLRNEDRQYNEASTELRKLDNWNFKSDINA